MKLLLAFVVGLFAYSVATAGRASVTPRTLTLIGICTAVALGFTARRFI